ncbi:hypothetical protein JCM10908_005872 [Rhodotorula pacifica]|uniref:Etp1p n=1 Tax=Rhodotorula pacifica TaxID=1495444 RepID=UPI00316D5F75
MPEVFGEVDDDRRYSIVIECYDHTAPVRSLVGESSSPLVPTTPTRLPPALDAELRASQHRLVLPPSGRSFWRTKLPATRALDTKTASTLSAAGSAATLAPSPTLEQRRTPSPRIWSESFGLPSPPPIATADLWTPSKGAVPTFGAVQHQAVVDFRFGPLAIDSIDYPEPRNNMAPIVSPRSAAATLPSIGATDRTSPSIATRPLLSSPPPLSSSPRPRETSGSTDLYWGTIHLYREAGASESTRDEKLKARDEDDGRTVGLISVPGVLNAAALLAFIAPALEDVEQVRMLRDSTPNRSLVLVRFRDAPSASEFRRMYNGKPYHDSKDSEVCHVVPISSIKLKSTTTPPFTYPYSSATTEPTSPGSSADPVELPTCPVCLELLDSRVTGLVQIMCQHSYHCQCLLKWGDSRCPVCRSTNARQRRNTVTSETSDAKCSTCQSPSNLWICVICGNVGCGRYQGGHAHSHFTETGHSFSLEIETGRIWSYLDDEYVHRLIRLRGGSVSNGGGAGGSADGDRLIELPSRAGRPSPGLSSSHPTGSNNDPDDLTAKIANSYGGPDRDAETEQDKLEALALEYGTLMTSQLSSQREWFEEEVAREKERVKVGEKVREGLEREVDKLKREVKDLNAEKKRAQEGWQQERKRLEDKIDAMQREAQHEADERRKERSESTRLRKSLESDLASERAVTASLSLNLGALRTDFTNEQEATKAVRAEVDELKDQLNDLMAALSMRDRIEQEGPESEWAGASVGLAPPPPTAQAQRQSPSAAKAAQRRKKKK